MIDSNFVIISIISSFIFFDIFFSNFRFVRSHNPLGWIFIGDIGLLNHILDLIIYNFDIRLFTFSQFTRSSILLIHICTICLVHTFYRLFILYPELYHIVKIDVLTS